MEARMNRFEKASLWGYAMADVGLWITGGVVFKWGAKILAKVGAIASETAFATTVKETFLGFFEKQKSLIENRLAVIKEKVHLSKGKKDAAKKETVVLSRATYRVAISNTIKAQQPKIRIHAALHEFWSADLF